jgi:isoquinoline 1-oxidoreductase beta subunit
MDKIKSGEPVTQESSGSSDHPNRESATDKIASVSDNKDDTSASFNASRRRFLQFMLSGSTSLVIGGAWLENREAEAAFAIPELGEVFDIADVVTLAELPYMTNLVLEITEDNRVYFELPRLDMGQGIATAAAQLVAEELCADYDRTDVAHSDRRADRPFSMTGNSSTIRTLWNPIRQVAAQARARLVTAAALRWDVDPELLSTADSKVLGPNGLVATYGELTTDAANVSFPMVSATPKSVSEYTLVGRPQARKNARDIVTGKQRYTLDIEVPGALPTVVARSPDIGGRIMSWDDSLARSMPGVVDIVEIPSGVAVIAESFNQAKKARDALVVEWAPGPVAGRSDEDFRSELERAMPPFRRTHWPFKSHSATFEYPFYAHAMMEVMAAIADVRDGRAEIWYASQSPNYIAEQVARAIGISSSDVSIHIPYAGGGFGRRLFGEAAIEAAQISQAASRPVKLMWTRNEDMRSGRFRPMARCAIRASWLGSSTTSFHNTITAAHTDLSHGLSDAFTAAGAEFFPSSFTQLGFYTMISLPYRFGSTNHRLIERDFGVPTGSWRSVFSGTITVSNEIFIDELAREIGYDEVSFRRDYLDNDAPRRCLEKVAEMGDWGRDMPSGQAQGVAIHAEYRSACAYLVEIDVTGQEPRLSRAFCAVDVGMPINPLGLKAQIEGCLVDAWSLMFRASNHIDDGMVRESAFTDYLWARMKHTPLITDVYVFPAREGGEPGGAGEIGFPPAAAACVNAYARATGERPRRFPIGELA